jgi:hypothetical protein
VNSDDAELKGKEIKAMFLDELMAETNPNTNLSPWKKQGLDKLKQMYLEQIKKLDAMPGPLGSFTGSPKPLTVAKLMETKEKLVASGEISHLIGAKAVAYGGKITLPPGFTLLPNAAYLNTWDLWYKGIALVARLPFTPAMAEWNGKVLNIVGHDEGLAKAVTIDMAKFLEDVFFTEL